jgi:hypothetical protein
MNWATFIASLESFFSSVGQIFLTNIKAAIPVLEQAASNFITQLVDEIVAGIKNGTIPLPVLAAEPGAVVPSVGDQKRTLAFNLVKEKLAATTIPADMTITDSLIYWQIETSVRKVKQVGNAGNFPGGNSGPVA